LKQLDLVVLVLHPLLNIFLNLVYAFLGKNVFEIHLFLSGSFSLVDELIYEFDFTVNKSFEREADKAIAAKEDNTERDCSYLEIKCENINAEADGYA
jgi:hypothetical protein